jgi:hypothetical protein
MSPLDQINYILDSNPTPSRARFVQSVAKQIEANPDVYPTEAQALILDRIYRHYRRVTASEVEKQVRESLGLPV